MNELVTGSAYVSALAGTSDRQSRTAFLDRAFSLLPGGGAVFDFGCGPGLDARAYAERGHLVHAYDIDPHMCAHARAACADLIAARSMRLIEAGHSDFMAMSPRDLPHVTLITANFAPLNLVPHLAPLFQKFATMLSPGGRVLASVLNPLHFGDLRYSWWWRGLPGLVARGSFSVPGAQAPITRWLPRSLARVAGGGFRLECIHVPSTSSAGPARRVHPGSPADWLAMTGARFLFVTLVRQQERR